MLNHVVILNDFAYVNGGASQVALSSAQGLASGGVDVTLFAAVGPVDAVLHEQMNLTVMHLDQQEILKDPNRWRAFRQGWWNRTARARFTALLDQLDPAQTVIHLHGWTKALSPSVVRAGLDKGFSLVCSMHDYFLACPNGAFYSYPAGHPCSLRALSLACLASNCDARSYSQKLWRFGRSVVQRKLGRLPDGLTHFIAVSDYSQKILRPYLPDQAQFYRVNNPIDVVKDTPVSVSENQIWTVVGRIAPEKGVHLLIQAANQWELPLTFVGAGPLEAAVATALPRAIVTGWLRHDQVIEQLRHARVLVFPSLLAETQGMVVLEAAALGIPAIVPDTNAAREFVENGVTGLWFRGGDAQDLRDKMDLLRDEYLAQRMGMAAYQQYWSHPQNLDSHVRELLTVYRHILSG